MARTDNTASTLAFLEGSRSGIRYSPDELCSTDPADGRTLLASYDPELARRRLTKEVIAGRRGGWGRWEERRAELGAPPLLAPSPGTAAGALAAYAAAAAVRATVVMPADAPAANQLEAVACSARLILLEGLISDCGKLARMLCEKTGAFDMATLREPYRVEGKKTLGFELAEDFGWALPEAVVYPTGGGTGLIGMWKAFEELEALGLIGSARPRMYAVQSEGCAPIVRAFERGAEFANQ